jgi:hypothetical protein
MMPRPKNIYPSVRFRLDGFVEMQAHGKTLHEREQKFLDWYLANRDERKAATLAKGMITAILNGEMGTQFVEAVEKGDTDEAVEALQDLLSVFAQ